MSVWRSPRNFPRFAPIIAPAGGNSFFLFSLPLHYLICRDIIRGKFRLTLLCVRSCTCAPPINMWHVCPPTAAYAHRVCQHICALVRGQWCTRHTWACCPVRMSGRGLPAVNLHVTLLRKASVCANVTAIYPAGD